MDNQTLFELIDKAWKCYINGPLHWSNTALPEELIHSLSWFVCVNIEPSHKTILLGIDRQLAKRVTSEMFGYDQDKAIDADIRDAVGEIANIIAGSIKNTKPDFSLQDSLEIPVHLESPDAQDCLNKLHIDAQALAFSSANEALYTAILDGAIKDLNQPLGTRSEP